MADLPKFLICTNPMFSDENLFILRTSKPCILLRVNQYKDGKFDLSIEQIYSGDKRQIEQIMQRAREWYIAYLASKKK